MRILGIGWDVGGWMGKKNAFAFSQFDVEKKDFSFLGKAFHTTVPSSGKFDIKKLAEEQDIHFEDYDKIVIGIDAPLGLPRGFKDLIQGKIKDTGKPEKEIYSPYAYRETERHLYGKFKKKALSAAFDKIGNNLTLALHQAHFWNKEYGFNIHPQQAQEDDSRIMIEVYPALAKMEGIYNKISPYIHHLKPTCNDDEWDACICSFIATVHGSGTRFLDNFQTQLPPQDEVTKEEGWVYYME